MRASDFNLMACGFLWLLILQVQLRPSAGFACDHADRVQLDYFPGLSNNSHFTKTRESDAGKKYCLSDFYESCLSWCAYDKDCVSVHLMLKGPSCVCHKCSLLLDQLPFPVRIAYGRQCNALGISGDTCISLACREKQQARMIAQFGSPYEEMPMLNSRVWMSSVLNDDLGAYGPYLAVDDDLKTFAAHRVDDDFKDLGYHWIIVELPFLARITHVTVKPHGTDSRLTTLENFVFDPSISGLYLLNWDILSISAPSDCELWARKDRGVLGARVLVIGSYFSNDLMCIYGQNADPSAWESAMGTSKLRVNVNASKCQLTQNLKPWKTLTGCKVYVIRGVYYGTPTQYLQGAQLLVTLDMPSVPETLFNTRSGIFYKNRDDGTETRKFNKLISWQHWTHCGDFSQLLCRTSQGTATIYVKTACTTQYSSFLAIRSTEPLSIADIQVYQAVTASPTSPTYKVFACPSTQYAGFAPEFVGSYIQPHVLDMSKAESIYNMFKALSDSARGKMTNNPRCSRKPHDLRTTMYDYADILRSGECGFLKNEINQKQGYSTSVLQAVSRSFVKSSLDSQSNDYVLNLLSRSAANFIAYHKISQRNIEILKDGAKVLWIDYLIKLFHPEDRLLASLLHKMRSHIYTRDVSSNSKLRSAIYADSHICFVACHWAHKFITDAKMVQNIQSEMKLYLFSWFMEAFCPNPCTAAKCQRVKNSENGQCIQGDEGLWQESYRCLCKPGYTWSNSARDCLLSSPCTTKRETYAIPQVQLPGLEPVPRYPCHPNNTQYCQSRLRDNVTIETDCICREGFGGKDCSNKADPCSDVHGEFMVTGNFACGKSDGFGKCMYHRSTTWVCLCAAGRERDLTLSKYDNCAAPRNACHTMVCSHGHFISSPNGAKCHCKCQPGYSGRSCRQWTGIWSPWSPWDRCLPECGSRRRSVSRRACINHEVLGNSTPFDFCVGSTERSVECDWTECWMGGERPLTKSLRLKARYLLLSATAGCLLGTIFAAVTVMCCRYRGYNIGFRPPFEPVYN